MHSIFALGFLALAGLSTAQDTIQNDYPYQIDPESVSESDKQAWCDNQKAQCPLICTQQPGVTSTTTIENDCFTDSLTYTCVCENGVSPNVTQYSQTLPYYICQRWGNQCVDNCNGQNTCESDCRENHPCGAQSPPPQNSSIAKTSTAASTSASRTPAPTVGFGGEAATDTPNGQGAAPAMLQLGQSYGIAVVIAGVFAGFALIL